MSKIENLSKEYYLNHPNVILSEDKSEISLRMFVHSDNREIISPRMIPTEDEKFYLTPKSSVSELKQSIILEGSIFHPGVQLIHNLLVLDGLKSGVLNIDPLTFAEEFSDFEPETIRRTIFSNWEKAIENSDGTIAFTEYGNNIDPGVIMGSIMQLYRERPVLGVSLMDKKIGRNDIFSNTISNSYITCADAREMLNSSRISNWLFEQLDKTNKPSPFPKKGIPQYDLLIVQDQSIGGILVGENLVRQLKSNREPVLLSTLTKDFSELDNLYDLAEIISRSKQLVVLGDDSAEPGIICVSALQLAKLMDIKTDFLRGDFRALIGEGKGAGSQQPNKELSGVCNLMIEAPLVRGIYTKMESLIEDLKENH